MAVATPLRTNATHAALRRRPLHVPADALLHPVALASLGLLVVNDHVLKTAAPGWWTGKLSDVAGLVLFPIFLVAGWELAQVALHRTWRPSLAAAAIAAVATAGIFALVELLPAADAVYEAVLGALQWPARTAVAFVAGQGLPLPVPAVATADTSDLLALPAVLVALAVLNRRGRAAEVRR